MKAGNQATRAAVHPDEYEQWRNHPVTEMLYADLEDSYLDSALDPLPITSIDQIAIEAIRRETARAFVDLIMEWVPKGVDPEEEVENYGNE